MNFITEAKAQEATQAATNQEFSAASFVPLILIFVIFYFLIIRPQNKKMKEHQALVKALKAGDKVITNSGIIGKITSINEKEDTLDLEISEGVNIEILRSYVSKTIEEEKKSSKKSNKKSKK